MIGTTAVTERFTGHAAAYAAARPSCPQAIVTDLQQFLQLPDVAQVADLGSGTGLSSEIFLRAGWTVMGVEPNAAMRAAAEKHLAAYARFRSVNGTAENATLPDHSVDLVVAAQAAHWFDATRARVQALRILRKPAWAALIWNERVSEGSIFAQGYEQLLRDFGTDYTQVRSRHADRALIQTFFGDAPLHERSYAHALMLDQAALRTLVASASYMPQPGAPHYEAMIDRLQQLFDRTQAQGRVRVDYVAWVFAEEIQC